MPSDWEDEERPPGKLPERARAGGGRPGAQVIRRRFVALASLIVVVVAVADRPDQLGWGRRRPGDRQARRRATAAAEQQKARAARSGSGKSAEVRNATSQPGWKPYKGPVPILEYHVLGHPPEGAPYPELYVGRSDFEKQMDWLEERGYEAVTLEQVQKAWYHGATLPPNKFRS